MTPKPPGDAPVLPVACAVCGCDATRNGPPPNLIPMCGACDSIDKRWALAIFAVVTVVCVPPVVIAPMIVLAFQVTMITAFFAAMRAVVNEVFRPGGGSGKPAHR